MTSGTYDAIVVGAGFAGATAARDLRERGNAVLVLEGRDRVGGRTWYRPFAGTDHEIELGGGWISRRTQHFATREIERYGLDLGGRPGDEAVDFRWRFGGELLRSFPLDPDDLCEFERAAFELIAAARRIDTNVPRDQQDLADLDVPIREWLDSLDVTPRTREWLDSWARLGSGAESDEWSFLQVASWIAAFGNSVWSWFAEVADHLEGGTASLLDSIIEDRDLEIRLSTQVTSIRQASDEVTVVTDTGEEFLADAVVVAVPVNLWSEIEFSPALAGAKKRLADEKHAGSMQKVWVHARNAPSNVIALGADSSMLWISAEYELDGDVLLAGFASPPKHLETMDPAAVKDAVRQLVPEAEILAIDSHDWKSDPFANGTWMVPRPGQLSTTPTEVLEPFGRLVFAGGDIATRWLGWIDGAIESGARAASLVNDLG